ncbi:hypothetical protein RQP46_006476 [Phenoliferia psychrophenolica]
MAKREYPSEMALPIAVDLLAPELDLDGDMSVDEISVARLSATQLLLASANPHLPVLVRQRAYAIYTTRKMVAESGMTTVRADEYMLASDHDFDLSDLTTLTPIQLLLTPFNPKATSALADAAYSRFKALRQRSKRAAREAELDGDSQPLSQLRAFSVTIVHDGRTQSETEGLELHVLSDCLSIRQSAESQVEVCRIPGARISDFCYIAGNPQPAGLPYRLAVERIYKDRGFVEIEQTRWLIACGADSMPDLRRYVAMVAKLVRCRDAFNVAWSSLKEVLESRRKDKGTFDPIDELIELASKLATRESLRLELFSDDRETATTKNKLDKDKFGVGPWRRYDAALKLLLEFEADARKKFSR